MSGFFENIVLLSSAVADADNQVMTHGRKLELLTLMADQVSSLSKSEISTTQKKIEDLCLRILFQNCPFVLIRPIVTILSGVYTKGAVSSMHACVSFLLQLASTTTGGGAGGSKLDRPIPGRDDSDHIDLAERSVCLSVAAGIVALRGQSASYFVPTILATVHKHVKLPDPAIRESAVNALSLTVQSVGVPGSSVGADMFKNIAYALLVREKSIEVRIAAGKLMALLCRTQAVLAHADTVAGLVVKFFAQTDNGGFGGNLVVARDTHVEILVSLLEALILTAEAARLKADPAAGEASPTAANNSSGISLPSAAPVASVSSAKSVKNFRTACGFILYQFRRHRSSPALVEALVTANIRLLLRIGAKEEDAVVFSRFVLSEISQVSVSVATRALARVLRSAANDSAVLRLLSETVLPVIRSATPTSSTPSSPVPENAVCVALAGVVEAMAIVEGSIAALDSDLSSDLTQLIVSTSSMSVAVSCAYTLRAFCRVCPSQAFRLVNVLLNHITIQVAELLGSKSSQSEGLRYTSSILRFATGLASVLCETVSSLPHDVTGAVIATAQSLIDPPSEDEETDTDFASVLRTAGFTLLVPIMGTPLMTGGKLLQVAGLWKVVLGKKARDALAGRIAPGAVINDIGSVIDEFASVLAAMRSIHAYVRTHPESTTAGDLAKLIVMLLNNGWQLCQIAVPLEDSTSASFPAVSVVVHAIRAELYESLLLFLDSEELDSMVKPLISFLSADISSFYFISTGGMCPTTLFGSILRAGSHFGRTECDPLISPTHIVDPADHAVERTGEGPIFLANAVHAYLAELAVGSVVPVKDYFSSPVASGSLEDAYSNYPGSHGSPVCVQTPYLPETNPLSPMYSQMLHPILQARSCSVVLLGSLLRTVAADRSTVESSVNVLLAAYRAVEPVSSVDIESLPPTAELVGVRADITLSTVLGVLAVYFAPVSSSDQAGVARHLGAAEHVLSVVGSPAGLGAAHPTVRRGAGIVIAGIYANHPELRDVIFQCVTDSAVSTTSRTRAGTASMIAAIVSLSPGAVTMLAPTLFRLARELVLPLRVSALHALYVIASGGGTIAPWTREVLKVTTAHAVADLHKNSVVTKLLAGIIAASPSDAQLLWKGFVSTDPDSKRFAVKFAARSATNVYFLLSVLQDPTTGTVLCQETVDAVTRVLRLSAEDVIAPLFRSLLEVSERDPLVRRNVDSAMKELVKTFGTRVLAHVLDALGVADPAVASDEGHVEDKDEYGSSDDDDEGSGPAGAAGGGAGAKAGTTTTCLATKSLLVKALKRIIKSTSSHAELRSKNCLDKVINVAVSSVGDFANPWLSLHGAKLLFLLIQGEAETVGTAAASSAGALPFFAEYETQISSALRKGVRVNSEASPAVQRVCLAALQTVVAASIGTSAADRLVELLVQPLVLIDPATMPWSTHFSIREAGNTVVSGRSPLAQSSEAELSSVLFTRVAVIVDLMRTLSTEEHEGLFRKHASFIHYYLFRMLVDCAIVLGKDQHSTQVMRCKNLFSLLPTDIATLFPQIRSVLIPCVVNGLALLNAQGWCAGTLSPPADCPVGGLDVSTLLTGVVSDLVKEDPATIGTIVWAAELVAFNPTSGGFPDILKLFELTQGSSTTPVEREEMLALSLKLVTNETYIESFSLTNVEIVWKITMRAITRRESLSESCIKSLGVVVNWLGKQQGRDGISGCAEILVNECLLRFGLGQPQAVLRVLREYIADTESVGEICAMIDSLTLKMREDDKWFHLSVLLLIPLYAKVVTLVPEEVSAEVIASLDRVRTALINAVTRSSDNTSFVLQSVSKLIGSHTGESSGLVSEFLLPLTIELMVECPNETVLVLPLLASAFGAGKGSPAWTKFVTFVLSLVSMDGLDEEAVGKAVLACMQPVAAFKQALSDIPTEDKSRVESVVRKFLPTARPAKRDTSTDDAGHESKEEPAAGGATGAPQIQLKLKFGK